jgi:hypothetical protein
MWPSGVFPSGVPGKRLLLAGVEVNATLLHPKTPQELENRRNKQATKDASEGKSLPLARNT